MKVILNKDLPQLGEEGDVKDVAKGYYRNFLGPRGIALPYNDATVRIFEARKDEIEARKVLKRQDAAGLKERLEALTVNLSMPAGPNGKLYGAVTVQTIIEELAKQNFPTERKRVELPGNSIKSTGKYKVIVKLYEGATAEVAVVVTAQEVKHETHNASSHSHERRTARRHEAESETAVEVKDEAAAVAVEAVVSETVAETTVAE